MILKKCLKVLNILFILSFTVNRLCALDYGGLEKSQIIKHVKNTKNHPFYRETIKYPQNLNSLPIGVFDSGTGGLTVLNSILTLDKFNNNTHKPGADGVPDFKDEKFEYLGDSANMPYGKYNAEGKAEFLRELIVKDAWFLINDKYFPDVVSQKRTASKEPVKVIVIACNTATAYGLELIREALEAWEVNIEVFGIVEAGAGEAVSLLQEADSKGAVIGILATEGTCATEAYPRLIKVASRAKFPKGKIEVVQQPGIGVAGAIDGDKDYILPGLKRIRESGTYKGPSVNSPDYPVYLNFWKEYNFDKKNNALLVQKDENGKIKEVQLNSPENYVKYSVTDLVLDSLKQFPDKELKAVVLGCTHYPYFAKEVKEQLLYLRGLDDKYKKIISENIKIIDPADALAEDVYEFLVKDNLFGRNSNMQSEFFISVPNPELKTKKLDEDGNFTYEHKYGRDVNTYDLYVKRVPLTNKLISTELLKRFEKKIPYTYKVIENYMSSLNSEKK